MKILLATVLTLLLFTSIQSNAAEPQQQGRYQIMLNPSVGSDKFLLDTWTGKVWQLTKFIDMAGEPAVWKFMDRIDDKKTNKEWIDSHLTKEEAELIKNNKHNNNINSP